MEKINVTIASIDVVPTLDANGNTTGHKAVINLDPRTPLNRLSRREVVDEATGEVAYKYQQENRLNTSFKLGLFTSVATICVQKCAEMVDEATDKKIAAIKAIDPLAEDNVKTVLKAKAKSDFYVDLATALTRSLRGLTLVLQPVAIAEGEVVDGYTYDHATTRFDIVDIK